MPTTTIRCKMGLALPQFCNVRDLTESTLSLFRFLVFSRQ